jgi:hypothetical protein
MGAAPAIAGGMREGTFASPVPGMVGMGARVTGAPSATDSFGVE